MMLLAICSIGAALQALSCVSKPCFYCIFWRPWQEGGESDCRQGRKLLDPWVGEGECGLEAPPQDPPAGENALGSLKFHCDFKQHMHKASSLPKEKLIAEMPLKKRTI